MVADPTSAVAGAFMELGAAVVQEVAKLKLAAKNALRCTLDPGTHATKVHVIPATAPLSWQRHVCSYLLRVGGIMPSHAVIS